MARKGTGHNHLWYYSLCGPSDFQSMRNMLQSIHCEQLPIKVQFAESVCNAETLFRSLIWKILKRRILPLSILSPWCSLLRISYVRDLVPSLVWKDPHRSVYEAPPYSWSYKFHNCIVHEAAVSTWLRDFTWGTFPFTFHDKLT